MEDIEPSSLLKSFQRPQADDESINDFLKHKLLNLKLASGSVEILHTAFFKENLSKALTALCDIIRSCKSKEEKSDNDINKISYSVYKEVIRVLYGFPNLVGLASSENIVNVVEEITRSWKNDIFLNYPDSFAFVKGLILSLSFSKTPDKTESISSSVISTAERLMKIVFSEISLEKNNVSNKPEEFAPALCECLSLIPGVSRMCPELLERLIDLSKNMISRLQSLQNHEKTSIAFLRVEISMISLCISLHHSKKFAQIVVDNSKVIAERLTFVLSNLSLTYLKERKEALSIFRSMLASDLRSSLLFHSQEVLDKDIIICTSDNDNYLETATIGKNELPEEYSKLAYMTLADFCHHARTIIPPKFYEKILQFFLRRIHCDTVSFTLQNVSVRVIRSMVDSFHNSATRGDKIKAREVVSVVLLSLIDKLETMKDSCDEVLQIEREKQRSKKTNTQPGDLLRDGFRRSNPENHLRGFNELFEIVVTVVKNCIWCISSLGTTKLKAGIGLEQGENLRNVDFSGSLSQREIIEIPRFYRCFIEMLKIYKDKDLLPDSKKKMKNAVILLAGTFTELQLPDFYDLIVSEFDLLFNAMSEDKILLHLIETLLKTGRLRKCLMSVLFDFIASNISAFSEEILPSRTQLLKFVEFPSELFVNRLSRNPQTMSNKGKHVLAKLFQMAVGAFSLISTSSARGETEGPAFMVPSSVSLVFLPESKTPSKKLFKEDPSNWGFDRLIKKHLEHIIAYCLVTAPHLVGSCQLQTCMKVDPKMFSKSSEAVHPGARYGKLVCGSVVYLQMLKFLFGHLVRRVHTKNYCQPFAGTISTAAVQSLHRMLNNYVNNEELRMQPGAHFEQETIAECLLYFTLFMGKADLVRQLANFERPIKIALDSFHNGNEDLCLFGLRMLDAWQGNIDPVALIDEVICAQNSELTEQESVARSLLKLLKPTASPVASKAMKFVTEIGGPIRLDAFKNFRIVSAAMMPTQAGFGDEAKISGVLKVAKVTSAKELLSLFTSMEKFVESNLLAFQFQADANCSRDFEFDENEISNKNEVLSFLKDISDACLFLNESVLSNVIDAQSTSENQSNDKNDLLKATEDNLWKHVTSKLLRMILILAADADVTADAFAYLKRAVESSLKIALSDQQVKSVGKNLLNTILGVICDGLATPNGAISSTSVSLLESYFESGRSICTVAASDSSFKGFCALNSILRVRLEELGRQASWRAVFGGFLGLRVWVKHLMGSKAEKQEALNSLTKSVILSLKYFSEEHGRMVLLQLEDCLSDVLNATVRERLDVTPVIEQLSVCLMASLGRCREVAQASLQRLADLLGISVSLLLGRATRAIKYLREYIIARSFKVMASRKQIAFLSLISFLFQVDPCPLILTPQSLATEGRPPSDDAEGYIRSVNYSLYKRLAQTLFEALSLTLNDTKIGESLSMTFAHPDVRIGASDSEDMIYQRTPSILFLHSYAFKEIPHSVSLRLMVHQTIASLLSFPKVSQIYQVCLEREGFYTEFIGRATDVLFSSLSSPWTEIRRSGNKILASFPIFRATKPQANINTKYLVSQQQLEASVASQIAVLQTPELITVIHLKGLSGLLKLFSSTFGESLVNSTAEKIIGLMKPLGLIPEYSIDISTSGSHDQSSAVEGLDPAASKHDSVSCPRSEESLMIAQMVRIMRTLDNLKGKFLLRVIGCVAKVLSFQSRAASEFYLRLSSSKAGSANLGQTASSATVQATHGFLVSPIISELAKYMSDLPSKTLMAILAASPDKISIYKEVFLRCLEQNEKLQKNLLSEANGLLRLFFPNVFQNVELSENKLSQWNCLGLRIFKSVFRKADSLQVSSQCVPAFLRLWKSSTRTSVFKREFAYGPQNDDLPTLLTEILARILSQQLHTQSQDEGAGAFQMDCFRVLLESWSFCRIFNSPVVAKLLPMELVISEKLWMWVESLTDSSLQAVFTEKLVFPAFQSNPEELTKFKLHFAKFIANFASASSLVPDREDHVSVMLTRLKLLTMCCVLFPEMIKDLKRRIPEATKLLTNPQPLVAGRAYCFLSVFWYHSISRLQFSEDYQNDVDNTMNNLVSATKTVMQNSEWHQVCQSFKQTSVAFLTDAVTQMEEHSHNANRVVGNQVLDEFFRDFVESRHKTEHCDSFFFSLLCAWKKMPIWEERDQFMLATMSNLRLLSFSGTSRSFSTGLALDVCSYVLRELRRSCDSKMGVVATLESFLVRIVCQPTGDDSVSEVYLTEAFTLLKQCLSLYDKNFQGNQTSNYLNRKLGLIAERRRSDAEAFSPSNKVKRGELFNAEEVVFLLSASSAFLRLGTRLIIDETLPNFAHLGGFLVSCGSTEALSILGELLEKMNILDYKVKRSFHENIANALWLQLEEATKIFSFISQDLKRAQKLLSLCSKMINLSLDYPLCSEGGFPLHQKLADAFVILVSHHYKALTELKKQGLNTIRPKDEVTGILIFRSRTRTSSTFQRISDEYSVFYDLTVLCLNVISSFSFRTGAFLTTSLSLLAKCTAITVNLEPKRTEVLFDLISESLKKYSADKQIIPSEIKEDLISSLLTWESFFGLPGFLHFEKKCLDTALQILTFSQNTKVSISCENQILSLGLSSSSTKIRNECWKMLAQPAGSDNAKLEAIYSRNLLTGVSGVRFFCFHLLSIFIGKKDLGSVENIPLGNLKFSIPSAILLESILLSHISFNKRLQSEVLNLISTFKVCNNERMNGTADEKKKLRVRLAQNYGNVMCVKDIVTTLLTAKSPEPKSLDLFTMELVSSVFAKSVFHKYDQRDGFKNLSGFLLELASHIPELPFMPALSNIQNSISNPAAAFEISLRAKVPLKVSTNLLKQLDPTGDFECGQIRDRLEDPISKTAVSLRLRGNRHAEASLLMTSLEKYVMCNGKYPIAVQPNSHQLVEMKACVTKKESNKLVAEFITPAQKSVEVSSLRGHYETSVPEHLLFPPPVGAGPATQDPTTLFEDDFLDLFGDAELGLDPNLPTEPRSSPPPIVNPNDRQSKFCDHQWELLDVSQANVMEWNRRMNEIDLELQSWDDPFADPSVEKADSSNLEFCLKNMVKPNLERDEVKLPSAGELSLAIVADFCTANEGRSVNSPLAAMDKLCDLQRLVDSTESIQLLHHVSSALKKATEGTTKKSKSLKLDANLVWKRLSLWRHLLPDGRESVHSWFKILRNREFLLLQMKRQMDSADFQELVSLRLSLGHDILWTRFALGHSLLKRGLPEAALREISALDGIITENRLQIAQEDLITQNIEKSRCLLQLRSQDKSSVSIENISASLAAISGLQLNGVQKRNIVGDIFRARAQLFAASKPNIQANEVGPVENLFSKSIQTYEPNASTWLAWHDFLAEVTIGCKDSFDAVHSVTMTGAILQAIYIGSVRARLLLPKVLWLLHVESEIIRGEHELSKFQNQNQLVAEETVMSLFVHYAHVIPTWIWLPWIPQLLSALSKAEKIAALHLLQNISYKYPQAAYSQLRVRLLEIRESAMIPEAEASGNIDAMASMEQVKASPDYANIRLLISKLHQQHPRVANETQLWAEELSNSCKSMLPLQEFEKAVTKLFNRSLRISTATEEVAKRMTVMTNGSRLLFVWYILRKLCAQLKPLTSTTLSPSEKFFNDLKTRFIADFSPDENRFSFLRKSRCDTAAENQAISSPDLSSKPGTKFSMSEILKRLWRWKLALQGEWRDKNQEAHIRNVSFKLRNISFCTLSVPGEFERKPQLTENSFRTHSTLDFIDSKITIFSDGETSYVKISFRGTDGVSRVFLVHTLTRSFSTLRSDFRSSQFNSLLNALLSRNGETNQRNLKLQSSFFLPVTSKMRLQSLQEETITFESVFQKSVCNRSKDLAIECAIRLSYDNTNDNMVKRMEGLEANFKSVGDNIVLKQLSLHSDSSCELFLRRRRLAQLLGVSSAVSILMGCSDRKASKTFLGFVGNSTLQEVGQNFTYDSTGKNLISPEAARTVPFRLTKNLRKAIGKEGVSGPFFSSMALTLWCLNSEENIHAVKALCKLLIRDDLVDNLLAEANSKRLDAFSAGMRSPEVQSGVERNVELLMSVLAKYGPHGKRFRDNSVSTEEMFPGTTAEVASDQVRKELNALDGDHSEPLNLDENLLKLMEDAGDLRRLGAHDASWLAWM